jgi:hypothetical protein
MTSPFSSSPDHISSGWCLHPSPKTRSSFSFTASAAQGSLHSLLLLGDFYKKLQSLSISLPDLKMIFIFKGTGNRGQGAGSTGAGSTGAPEQGEALKRLNFNGFIFCLCPNHLGGCYTAFYSLSAWCPPFRFGAESR